MRIEVLSAQYDNAERTTYTAIIRDADGKIMGGEPFPYGVIVGQADEGPVYGAVMSLMGGVEIAEHVADPEALAAQARAKRDALLSASDYYVMPDYPATDLEAVCAYRQALRDLTAQANFPSEINWPKKPSVLA